MSDHYDRYNGMEEFLRDTQYNILGTNLAEVGTDCISRQAAIEDVKSWKAVDGREKHLQKDVIEWLKEFPSMQPKKGKWIKDANKWMCDKCGELVMDDDHNFCPNCGAEMEVTT